MVSEEDLSRDCCRKEGLGRTRLSMKSRTEIVVEEGLDYRRHP